jgi:hypothetical protein
MTRDQGVTSTPSDLRERGVHATDSPVGVPVSCCPACQVVAELTTHRDATAGGWSVRRSTLNFAIVIAQRACPSYVVAAPGAAADYDEDQA